MRIVKLFAIGALAALVLVPVGTSTAWAEKKVADLSITMTDDPDPVVYRWNVTYTATVSNVGPEDAASVRVELWLHSEMNFVSGSVSQGSWSYPGGVMVAKLGSIEAGKSATVTLVGSVHKSVRIPVTGSVSSPSNDPVPENDTWTEWTAIVDGPPPPDPTPTPSGGVSTGLGGTAEDGPGGLIGVLVLLVGATLVGLRLRAARG